MFPSLLISIIRETKTSSLYKINNSTINFEVKGDELYFETALASIISKYIRELMMIAFNNYWKSRIPNIKRTAGYPQDGKRFIANINDSKLEYNKNTLIRIK